MIATVPSWPARPLFRRRLRLKGRLRSSTEFLGRALEVVGLLVFVTVIGIVPVIVAAFAD